MAKGVAKNSSNGNQLYFSFQVAQKNKILTQKLSNIIKSSTALTGVLIIGEKKSGKTTILEELQGLSKSKTYLVNQHAHATQAAQNSHKKEEKAHSETEAEIQNAINWLRNTPKEDDSIFGTKQNHEPIVPTTEKRKKNKAILIDDIDKYILQHNNQHNALFLLKSLIDNAQQEGAIIIATASSINTQTNLPDLTSRLKTFHQEFII